MIRPFGESAFLVELGGPDEAQAAAAALEFAPGVVEVVLGLRSLLIEVDPDQTDAGLADRLSAALDRPAAPMSAGRLRTIPVVYGGEHGPDLDEVAAICGLAPDEVIRRHASAELRVLFMGFAPGYAYIGDLPEGLRVPRLAKPRTRTPAGSVAIAGRMTGIYPADLPGGWRIIGRTSVTLFDPHREPPAFLSPGDRIRFEPVDE